MHSPCVGVGEGIRYTVVSVECTSEVITVVVATPVGCSNIKALIIATFHVIIVCTSAAVKAFLHRGGLDTYVQGQNHFSCSGNLLVHTILGVGVGAIATVGTVEMKTCCSLRWRCTTKYSNPIQNNDT